MNAWLRRCFKGLGRRAGLVATQYEPYGVVDEALLVPFRSLANYASRDGAGLSAAIRIDSDRTEKIERVANSGENV